MLTIDRVGGPIVLGKLSRLIGPGYSMVIELIDRNRFAEETPRRSSARWQRGCTARRAIEVLCAIVKSAAGSLRKTKGARDSYRCPTVVAVTQRS